MRARAAPAQSNKVVDYGLAVAAPLHGHCAMNYVRCPKSALAQLG
jgi:hypothetical protein